MSNTMQNSKPRTSSSEAPPKVSPRAARPLKLKPPEFSTSPGLGNRTPKDRSPKVSDRRSPRSPICERKRPSRVSELESQILQVQEDLKNVKNQLAVSESSKKDAQYNLEESKKELQMVAAKFDESQKQLSVLFASKEALDIEFQSILEKDQAWKSQLEAVKKQLLIDSTTLASANDEIQKLKLQLDMVDMVAESEDAQGQSMESVDAEIHILRRKLAETVSLVEITRNELIGSKESEARARKMAQETLLQLEKEIVYALRLDDMKAKEAINSVSWDSDDTYRDDDQPAQEGPVENHDIAEAEQLEREIKVLKIEMGYLKCALEASEMRINAERARRSREVRRAGELLEHINSSSRLKEAELEEKLKKAKEVIEVLRALSANLLDKDVEIDHEKELGKLKMDIELKAKELGKLKVDIEELKANLVDNETELQLEENAILKIEAMRRETDRSTDNAVSSEVEASRAAEQEALAKLSQVMEDADERHHGYLNN